MKANIAFEIAEDGRERAVAQLITDDGEELAILPCVGVEVRTIVGKRRRVTLTMTFETEDNGKAKT